MVNEPEGDRFKACPRMLQAGTPYKVSLRDVFSLDSRLRGNDEGLCTNGTRSHNAHTTDEGVRVKILRISYSDPRIGDGLQVRPLRE